MLKRGVEDRAPELRLADRLHHRRGDAGSLHLDHQADAAVYSFQHFGESGNRLAAGGSAQSAEVLETKVADITVSVGGAVDIAVVHDHEGAVARALHVD